MHPKRLAFFIIFVLFVGFFFIIFVFDGRGVVVLSWLGASSSMHKKVIVFMQQDRFEPEEIQIDSGTEVVFKNNDVQSRWPASNLHPTHGIYPEFDPQESISPDGEWSFVFKKKGRWRYHDHLLPNVRGVIVVE